MPFPSSQALPYPGIDPAQAQVSCIAGGFFTRAPPYPTCFSVALIAIWPPLYWPVLFPAASFTLQCKLHEGKEFLLLLGLVLYLFLFSALPQCIRQCFKKYFGWAKWIVLIIHSKTLKSKTASAILRRPSLWIAQPSRAHHFNNVGQLCSGFHLWVFIY